MRNPREYLLLLWLFCTKPVWAWDFLQYFLHYKLVHSNRYTDRVGEYSQFVFPIGEALKISGEANQVQVNKALELFREVPFRNNLITGVIPSSFDASEDFAKLCYCMVRLRKPSTVIETGVGRGVISYYVLYALKENDKGHLYSIELPLPNLGQGYRYEVGKFVPLSLRARWTLTFGAGVRKMKGILDTVGTFNMFIHDSMHTYQNQLAEFRIALTGMKTGGIVISDDINNNALLEASEQFGCQPIVTTNNKSEYLGYLGIIVKRS